MTPLVIIRPQPGCDATLAAAKHLRLDARAFPLFAVSPVAWSPPEPDTVDALLIGSANAVRHGGQGLLRYTGKPAYVVGRVTADAANEAGLTVAAVGTEGLQPVLDSVDPAHARLLRLAGRERLTLSPPAGVTMVERIVYASEPQPMPTELAGMLALPAVVMLHSAEAARHFAAECDRLAIARGAIALATIGPRVTHAAGTGWEALKTAETAQDAALLALARDMCQNRPCSSAE